VRPILVGAAALVVALATSGVAEGAAAGGGVNPPPVTVRFATLSVASVFYDLALEKGFFLRRGIDFQVLPFTRSPHDALAGVIGGGVDMGYFGSPVLIGVASGIPMKVVGSPPDKTIPFDLVARPGITQVADLKGKVVYGGGLGGGTHQALQQILRVSGFKPGEVTVMASTGEAEMILRSGKVDAVITSGLTRAKLIEDGLGSLIARSRDYYGHYQHSYVFAADAFIKSHPETVRNYFLAARDLYQYALDHLDEVVDYTAKRFKLKRETIAAYYRETFAEWDLSFQVDLEGTANAVTILKELKEIRPGVTFEPERWLDLRFLE